MAGAWTDRDHRRLDTHPPGWENEGPCYTWDPNNDEDWCCTEFAYYIMVGFCRHAHEASALSELAYLRQQFDFVFDE